MTNQTNRFSPDLGSVSWPILGISLHLDGVDMEQSDAASLLLSEDITTSITNSLPLSGEFAVNAGEGRYLQPTSHWGAFALDPDEGKMSTEVLMTSQVHSASERPVVSIDELLHVIKKRAVPSVKDIYRKSFGTDRVSIVVPTNLEVLSAIKKTS